jgi:N-acyl homoserine lactone hydrolase
VPNFGLEDVIPLHLADVTFPEWHPLRGQAGEIFAFALRHPSGLILYETGIGQGSEVLDNYYQVNHRSIEAELEVHGHGVADVRLVVNSHLHFDHCGNNMSFPGVPIFVQAIEYEVARQPNYTVPEWVDFEGAEYAVITGDAQVASGVRVISTPGHTAGHQSLVLDTRSGTVALAGQAIYSKAEYEHIRTTGTTHEEDPPPDPVQYLASATRLLALRPLRVYFSHDRAVWNESRQTP